MSNPKQIMFDDFVMAQIEDQKTGILFFISEITFEDLCIQMNKSIAWRIISIVRCDE